MPYPILHSPELERISGQSKWSPHGVDFLDSVFSSILVVLFVVVVNIEISPPTLGNNKVICCYNLKILFFDIRYSGL